jgi:tetratricopeptide (TPR) repeat protein
MMKKTKHLSKPNKIIPLTMDATFFYEKAVKSLDRYRYDQALKYFRKAVEYDPNNPVNHCSMAGVLSEMGQYAESNRMLKQIVERIDPSMTECYFYMANNFANMEDYEAAETALAQYLEQDDQGYYLDESEEMMEWLSLELDRPMKVKKIKSQAGLYEHDRARALLEEGRFAEAIRLLEKLVKQHPEFLAAYNNLALAYFYVGQAQEALYCVQRVLDLDPGNLHAICNMAIFYQHAGDQESLEQLLNSLRKTVPYHHEHVFKLATTLGVLGYHELALQHFHRLLKTEAGKVDACLFHYAAVAQYNSRNYTAARNLWIKAGKLDPQSDIPKFYLAILDRISNTTFDFTPVTLSYHYHLPIEEQFKALNRARKQGEAEHRLSHDPLLCTGFYWALNSNNRRLKLTVIQYFQLLQTEEMVTELEKILISRTEEDYFKNIIMFIMRNAGIKKPLHAFLNGREQMIKDEYYAPNLPIWDSEWQAVLDMARQQMTSRYYDLIQQFDMVTLWVEFLTRSYPHVPKLLKISSWAAALEYLTAKMHNREATYQEIANFYDISVSTLSKRVKMIDEICGLREKMHAIFANLHRKM